MGKAARAIIFDGRKMLVMYRNKHGSEYYTLVGGRVNEGESTEQALVREIYEETGLTITGARLVFTEEHAPPYNDQFIYLCSVAPHDSVKIHEASEEGLMNRIGANTHEPIWVDVGAFPRLQFRTPQLHAAILQALKKGFPTESVQVSTRNT
jgi:ADP-ribose pyrophosphatase YjhB (NUDIX family)